LESEPELTQKEQRVENLLGLFQEAHATGAMEVLRAQQELNLEDVGWKKLGESVAGYDLKSSVRERSVKMSREMVIKSPLCRRAVSLWTNFGIGDGIRLTTPAVAANKMLEALWRMEANSEVLGDEGQRKSSNRLLVDGEVFFIIDFTEGKSISPVSGAGIGNVSFPRMQRVKTEEITEIISSPGDEDDVIAYERTIPRSSVSVDGGPRGPRGPKKRIYWDWKAADRFGNLTLGQGRKKKEAKVETGQFIYHVKVNGLGLRGHPILTSVLPWALAHVKFMEARVNIQRMIATFAMKARIKGTSRTLASLRNKFASTMSTGGATDPEKNPLPATGSLWLENEGMDLQPMKMETGATSAAVDGAMILTTFALGVDLYPHYFGVVEGMDVGTAGALEVPLVKGFAAYQEMWGQVYREMSLFILKRMKSKGANQLQINVDFPELVNRDRAKMVEALSRIFSVAPWLMEIDEVVKIALTQLGVKDTEAVWARVGKEVKETVRKFVETMSQKQAQGMKGQDPRNQMADKNQNKSGGEGPTKPGGNA